MCLPVRSAVEAVPEHSGKDQVIHLRLTRDQGETLDTKTASEL